MRDRGRLPTTLRPESQVRREFPGLLRKSVATRFVSSLSRPNADRDSGSNLFDFVCGKNTNLGSKTAKREGLHLEVVGSRVLLQSVAGGPLQVYGPWHRGPS